MTRAGLLDAVTGGSTEFMAVLLDMLDAPSKHLGASSQRRAHEVARDLTSDSAVIRHLDAIMRTATSGVTTSYGGAVLPTYSSATIETVSAAIKNVFHSIRALLVGISDMNLIRLTRKDTRGLLDLRPVAEHEHITNADSYNYIVTRH